MVAEFEVRVQIRRAGVGYEIYGSHIEFTIFGAKGLVPEHPHSWNAAFAVHDTRQVSTQAGLHVHFWIRIGSYDFRGAPSTGDRRCKPVILTPLVI